MNYTLTADAPLAASTRDIRAIPVEVNLAIASAVALAHFYIFILLPLYLLPHSAWWGLTLLPFFFMHSAHWGLIHEAIHKNFHPDRKVNENAGRILSILMGISYHVVHYGHLMHHKLNRDWESEWVDRRNWHDMTLYYVTLMGGLYLKEIIGGLLLALFPPRITLPEKGWSFLKSPEARITCRRYFFERGNVNPLRMDVALGFMLHGLACYLYGSYVLLFAAFLISRALMLSFMDNIYHYDTTHDMAGKNLRVALWAEKLLLNSNYHRVHHANPALPWTALPTVNDRIDGGFIHHGLMQFKGPILRPTNTA